MPLFGIEDFNARSKPCDVVLDFVIIVVDDVGFVVAVLVVVVVVVVFVVFIVVVVVVRFSFDADVACIFPTGVTCCPSLPIPPHPRGENGLKKNLSHQPSG